MQTPKSWGGEIYFEKKVKQTKNTHTAQESEERTILALGAQSDRGDLVPVPAPQSVPSAVAPSISGWGLGLVSWAVSHDCPISSHASMKLWIRTRNNSLSRVRHKQTRCARIDL